MNTEKLTSDEVVKINVVLTVEQLQLVINALGQQPFHQVYELIGELNDQVNAQLQEK